MGWRVFHGFGLEWSGVPHRFGGFAAGVLSGGEGEEPDRIGGRWTEGPFAELEPHDLPDSVWELLHEAGEPRDDASVFHWAKIGNWPPDEATIEVQTGTYELDGSGLRVWRLPPVVLSASGGHRCCRNADKEAGEEICADVANDAPELAHRLVMGPELLAGLHPSRCLGGEGPPTLDHDITPVIRGFVLLPTATVRKHATVKAEKLPGPGERMPSHLTEVVVHLEGAVWQGEELVISARVGMNGGCAAVADRPQCWSGEVGYAAVLLVDLVHCPEGARSLERPGGKALLRTRKRGRLRGKPDRKPRALSVEGHGPVGLSGVRTTVRARRKGDKLEHEGRLIRTLKHQLLLDEVGLSGGVLQHFENGGFPALARPMVARQRMWAWELGSSGPAPLPEVSTVVATVGTRSDPREVGPDGERAAAMLEEESG